MKDRRTPEQALYVAHRIGAGRIGINPDVYAANVARGWHWCTVHKQWHDRAEFGSDKSRTDGIAKTCLNAVNARRRAQRKDGGL